MVTYDKPNPPTVTYDIPSPPTVTYDKPNPPTVTYVIHTLNYSVILHLELQYYIIRNTISYMNSGSQIFEINVITL